MPKKEIKNGVGGKKAAMTVERLLHVEQRSKEEDEMAEQKLKMMTEVIAGNLQKEEQYSAINQLKLTTKWRSVLRQTKAQELRGDINVLKQTFERTMDHKDKVIKTLLDQIRAAKQQSHQSLRSNQENIEQLLELQKNRLASLNQVFGNELDELRAQQNAERERIMTQHQQDMSDPQDGILALDVHHTELESENQLNYKIACYDMKNWYERLRSAEQLQLWEQLVETWQQAKDTHKCFHDIANDKRAACQMLQARVERSSAEIPDLAKKLHKMQKSHEALQARMKSDKKNHEDYMAATKILVESKKKKAVEMNSLMRRLQAKRDAKLTSMVEQKHQASKRLKAIAEKGRKLVWLAEACRKLEMRSEREQPLYCSSESSEQQSMVVDRQQGSSELHQLMDEYAGLKGVWARHSKAQLEKACLKRYQVELMQENLRLWTLKRQIKTAVNDGVHRRSSSPTKPNHVTQCQRRSPGRRGARGLRN